MSNEITLLERMAAPAAINATDENEADNLTSAQIDALFAQKEALVHQRRPSISARKVAPSEARGLQSPNEEFAELINLLELRHFSPEELLALGGQHHTPGDECENKNALPPKHLWSNILDTAIILDELRERLGFAIAISSAYRNEPYNTCVGGVGDSQHLNYKAIDFVGRSGRSLDWAQELCDMRKAGMFRGGIGLYNTFVHVDTRGNNKTWRGKRTPQSLFNQLDCGN